MESKDTLFVLGDQVQPGRCVHLSGGLLDYPIQTIPRDRQGSVRLISHELVCLVQLELQGLDLVVNILQDDLDANVAKLSVSLTQRMDPAIMSRTLCLSRAPCP